MSKSSETELLRLKASALSQASKNLKSALPVIRARLRQQVLNRTKSTSAHAGGPHANFFESLNQDNTSHLPDGVLGFWGFGVEKIVNKGHSLFTTRGGAVQI